MNTILLTGAAGNVGSALTRCLLEKGHRVIAVDNLSTGNIGKLPSRETP